MVPPERSRRSQPFVILIGEAPGEREENEGRPFVGPAGFELQRTMQAVGLKRADCHITNACLCRPPGNKIERAEKDAQARNKKLEPDDIQQGLGWLSPIDACRPRLLREIAENSPSGGVITLGGSAYRAATGRREKPMEVRGGPRQESFGRLLPTLHPSFVMRSRRWTRAFMADMARAVRWFTTGLAWTDPTSMYLPSSTRLRAWIESEAGSPFVVYDVETAPAFPEWEKYDPMEDRLRCVGLSSHDGKRAINIPFRSVEDPNRLFYSESEYREIISILRDFFSSPRWRKAGHNSGYYDRMVIERHFKVTPTPHVDTIGLHKFTEPELPHNLGYVGSIYTDVDSWKMGKPGSESRTDRELWEYNVKDCAVTALSLRQLSMAVEARNQVRQARFWPFLQDLCVDMHKIGMHVDQNKRREWDAKFLKQAQEHLKLIREMSEMRNFNPGSFQQVANLLFDDWKLLPVDYTEMGDPSTGDDSLREILAKQNLEPRQRTTIENIRLYRRRVKFRGTYTLKLRPMNEVAQGDFFAFDDEENPEERERRREKEMKKPGIVLADGRVHSDWNAHGTLGWRLSSSNTNLQNVPTKIRDIFDEEPGWCLVACDAAQLELRMGAALANSKAYLDAFNEKRDPHREFCIDIFGEEFSKASPKQQKAFRRLVKELTYASEYRAEVETVHSVLTSSEDEEEKLLYPTISISQVAAMHRKWLARAKFDRWWEETDRIFSTQGFLLDPVLGLRADFLDGQDDPQIGNKLVNFLCQSGGAGLVHLATKRFIIEMPRDWKSRGVRIVNQGHDALVARVPKDHDRFSKESWCPEGCNCLASRVAKFLEECFRIDGREFGLPITFEGEAKIGSTWQEV